MASHTFSFQAAPKSIVYGRELRNGLKKNSLLQIRQDVFALSDCLPTGKLNKKYAIIAIKHDDNGSVTYTCSCLELNCCHVNELKWLVHPDTESNFEPEEFTYEFIRDSLFSVYCKTDKSYAVLKRTPRRHNMFSLLNSCGLLSSCDSF